MCLHSLVYKGINKKTFKSICSDIISCYGPQQIVTISNLMRLGMFNEQGQYSGNFT